MKTQKFGSDYQACAHAYAYAPINEKGENYGTRMFFENDIMYSYGYHYKIAKKVRNARTGKVDHVLVNGNDNSRTTNKQKGMVWQALPYKKLEVYEMICNNSDGEGYPVQECKEQERRMLKAVDNYDRARAEYMRSSYLAEIVRFRSTIEYLASYYRIKSKLPSRFKKYFKNHSDFPTTKDFLNSLSEAKESRSRSLSIQETKKEKRRRAAIVEQIAREKESLVKWRNHELRRVYLNYTHGAEGDFLRVSQDGQLVETTQGVAIPVKEAQRVLKLIERGKVIGTKIDGKYTVDAFNGLLKVGCHRISREEIENIKNQIS